MSKTNKENDSENKKTRFAILVLNPIALRKAIIVHNFGLSECNGFNIQSQQHIHVHYHYVSLKYFKWLK